MNKACLPCFVAMISWLLGFTQLVVGQESELVVRTAVDPIDHVLVGQRIKLTIDVLAKDAWASIPRLPQIEIKGAIVYLPDGQSLRLGEAIDGDSYTGQRYEWWVYPRRKGTVSIKPFDIEISQKTFGANSDSVVTSAKTKLINLIATYPEGVRSANDLVCANNLKVRDEWNPATTEHLKIGDGVTRTITRTISGAPGMLLPTIPPEKFDSVRAYPKQSGVNDTSNRGNLVGNRSDAVTYVFETSGTFTFPTKQFIWWNEGTKQLETVELPARSFEVAALVNSSEPSAIAKKPGSPQVSRSLLAWMVPALLLALVACFTLNRMKPKYRELVASSFVQEPNAFTSLVAAARSRKTNETIRQLYLWMNFPLCDQDAPQIEVLLERFGSKVDETQVRKLLSAESSANWDAAQLILACKLIRKNWRRSAIRFNQEKSFRLPVLNPHQRYHAIPSDIP